MKEITHNSATIGDINIHYAESGADKQELVLLLHGFPEFWYTWRQQLPDIGESYHAVAPDIPGLQQTGFIDHVGLFGLRKLPDRLAVIGGGAIGAEMGQALSRLGSQVTIIQRPDHLLSREDPEITAVLQNAFSEEGIATHLAAAVVRVSQGDKSKEVQYEQNRGTDTIAGCDLYAKR